MLWFVALRQGLPGLYGLPCFVAQLMGTVSDRLRLKSMAISRYDHIQDILMRVWNVYTHCKQK